MSLSKPNQQDRRPEEPSGSKSRREVCTHQRQEDIINLVEGLYKKKREELINRQRDPPTFTPGFLPLKSDVIKLASELLQISESCVRRYCGKNIEEVETPGKKRIRKPIPGVSAKAVDDFTRDSILQVIYRMYHQGKHVSLDTVLSAIRDSEIDFKGSKSSLNKLLKVMGFKWHSDNGRKALMEEPDICAKRIGFLREYLQQMSAGMNFVFLDETWIFSKGTVTKTWQDNTKFTCKRCSTNDGKRFIILHAGSRKGFVEGASLLFASKKTTGDYHGEMNGANFETWLKEKLLPSLEGPSVIVLDNAPYHSVQSEKMTTAVYSSDWFNTTDRFRKGLVFLMTRCQKTINISAGKYYTVSLETYAKLLNSSYKYFALLQQLNK